MLIIFYCKEILGTEEEETGKCFPGDSMLFDWNFETIKMKDLRIGDKILSASPSGEIIYDEVIGFLHYRPSDSSNYLLISTNNRKLSITEKHVLLTTNNN